MKKIRSHALDFCCDVVNVRDKKVSAGGGPRECVECHDFAIVVMERLTILCK